MITHTAILRQTPPWQTELARAVTDPHELLSLLGLDPASMPARVERATAFPMRVPRGFLARIRKGDPDDPLLRQILPLADEALPSPGFEADPVGDLAAMKAPGLLQKYHGRALLITTGACAVHCRYCFRRHFPYGETGPSRDEWRRTIELLRADASIAEVILSGGDPLVLSDARLHELTDALADIPTIKRLRVHTRVPVVLPERVDAGLKAWLTSLPLSTVIVLHVNHAAEIDASVRHAVSGLAATGAVLLNQSVLLRGINDNVRTLCELSETLFDAGVLPYYLHLMDPVQGAAHFDVDGTLARSIIMEVAARLPGYLVPRLVRERAGSRSKLPVFIE
jgi:EF-P beta-lysylation protein EpmB